ncbi:hypothetical protein OG809_33300 [Kribbella soli]
MNLRLDPPPVPPLDPARRAQLRKRVMDKSRPLGHRPARRWIAPAVGAVAVAAVVAGTLVITNRPPADPGVAGPATAATPTGLEVVPDAEATDAFAKSCERGGHLRLGRPLTVVWARRVPGANPKNTEVLMVLKGSGTSGRAACLAPSGAGMWERNPSEQWVKLPTQKEGLAGLMSAESAVSTPKPASRMWRLYRVRPEIARIETRLVWKGNASPWQRGYVDSGYAYADNRVDVTVNLNTVRQEVRAYDAQGRLLPIVPR